MGRGSRKEKKKVKVCLDINRPSHGRTWDSQPPASSCFRNLVNSFGKYADCELIRSPLEVNDVLMEMVFAELLRVRDCVLGCGFDNRSHRSNRPRLGGDDFMPDWANRVLFYYVAPS